jgi:hypothetical protein
MWMDAYVQEVLIREQIAHDQKTAARDHQLAQARARAAAERPRLPRIALRLFIPRLARRIVGMAAQ